MAIAKFTADIVLDAACDYVKNNVTEMYICSGANNPANRAGAISAALASKTGLTSASFTGPADGTTSGRKITKNAETGISVTASGDATCIALCSGTTLLHVHSVTLQNLTSGNTVNTPAFRVIEILDVTP
jgi:hypothetical protein